GMDRVSGAGVFGSIHRTLVWRASQRNPGTGPLRRAATLEYTLVIHVTDVSAKYAHLFKKLWLDHDRLVFLVCRFEAQAVFPPVDTLERGFAVVQNRSDAPVGDVLVHEQHVVAVLDPGASH